MESYGSTGLLKSSCVTVLFLMTLTISAKAVPKMVKRQAPTFQLQIGVGPNRETYLATGDDVRILALTGPSTGTVCLSSGQSLIYTGDTSGSVVISGTGTQTIPVKRYDQLLESQTETFTSSPSPVIQNVQGCLYYDNCTAFFTTNALLINFIASNRPNFPVPEIDINIVRRGDTLQVNVDQTPDGVASSEDDIVNLRGAETFELSGAATIAYANDRVTVFEGSIVEREIGDVDVFHVIEDIDGLDGGGQTVMIFMDSASRFFTGPGSVYIGFNDANQRVVCFIKSQNVSEQIGTDLVRTQIIANESGVVMDRLTGQQLIDLHNSQEFAFETAHRIVYKNGIISIYNRFDSLIHAFGSQRMPITLGSYFNNQAELTGPSQCRNFTVPSGGLVLYYNAQDNMMFAYPASNRFLAAGIQTAILQANHTVSALPIDLRLDVNQLGQGTLVLDGVSVILATTSRNTSLPPESIVTMPSGSEIQVSRDSVLLRRPVSSVQMATVVTGPTQGNVFTPQVGQVILLSQGGTLFTDVNNNVLVASRSSGVQSFLSGAIEDIPLLKVNVRNSVVNSQPQVTLSAAGTFLFNATNPDTLTTTQDQRIVYLNGSVNAATATQVPSTAQVLYISSVPEVQIIDNANRNIILQTRLNGPLLTTTLMATTASIEPVSGNAVLQGGGVYYMGKAGAAYLTSDVIDSISLRALNSVNALDKCIENVNRVIVFQNGRLRFFTDGFSVSLPGDGTSFIVSDQMFHTTDRSVAQNIRSANSRAFPLQLDCDEDGMVIISRNGVIIYSFALSSAMLNLGENDVVVFEAMTLSGPTVFGGDFSPISSLTVYDGISNDTSDSSLNITGSGLLIIDKQLESAFFTSDRLSVARIKDFLANKMNSLRAPYIEDARPLSFASMQSEVEGRFGQIITAAVSSIINLRCVASIANPPATFTFSQRDRNNASIFISLRDALDVTMKRNGLNNYTLQIANVPAGETEYRCEASNFLSTATIFSRIVGVAGRAPEIQNNFFTGGIIRGTAVVTAQVGLLPTIMPIIDVSDVDDRSQITDRVIIGCKAKGRPMPKTTWSTIPPDRINFTLLSYNVSNPGPGRSLLFVSLAENDLQCVTYICTASNGLGSQNGSARVCPQQFVRQASPGRVSNCSVECGIGTRLVFSDYTRMFDGGQEMVAFEDIPAGLVEPESRFCISPTCPTLTFLFETSNYTHCSEFCGTGRQSRNVTCIRQVGNEAVVMDNMECTSRGVQRPPSTRNCRTLPCPEYIATPFGPCSRTCRGGVMSRNVTCGMVDLDDQGMFELGNTTEVPIEICERYSRQPEPEEVVSCNENIMCPVRFLPSAFGPCDKFNCQERTFTCVNSYPSYPNEVWPTDDVVCEDQGLIRIQPVRSCEGRPCSFGQWHSTATGVCSAVCGNGLRSFNVVCLNRTTEEVIDNGYCNGNARPKDTDSCFVRNCPGDCLQEPSACSAIALFRACKMVDTFSVIRSCCKSCPLQATPIPPL